MEATAPVLLLEQIHTEHGQQASVASQSENSSVRVPVDALATAQASRTSTSSPSTSPLVSSVTSGLAAPSQSGQCLDPLSRKQPNIAELLRQAGRSEDVILDLTSAGAHLQCDEATPLRSRWLGFSVQGAYAPVHVQRSATQHFGIVNAAEGTSYIAGDLLRLKYNKLEYEGHLIAVEQLSGHYWLHVLIGDTVWRFPFSRNAPAREGRVTYTELHRLLSSVKKHERSTPPDTEKRRTLAASEQSIRRPRSVQSKRSATVLQSEKRERARLQEQVRHLSAELHQRDAELADTRHKMARSTAEPATAHKRESEVHHRQKEHKRKANRSPHVEEVDSEELSDMSSSSSDIPRRAHSASGERARKRHRRHHASAGTLIVRDQAHNASVPPQSAFSAPPPPASMLASYTPYPHYTTPPIMPGMPFIPASMQEPQMPHSCIHYHYNINVGH